jgi:hypothetical protein
MQWGAARARRSGKRISDSASAIEFGRAAPGSGAGVALAPLPQSAEYTRNLLMGSRYARSFEFGGDAISRGGLGLKFQDHEFPPAGLKGK